MNWRVWGGEASAEFYLRSEASARRGGIWSPAYARKLRRGKAECGTSNIQHRTSNSEWGEGLGRPNQREQGGTRQVNHKAQKGVGRNMEGRNMGLRFTTGNRRFTPSRLEGQFGWEAYRCANVSQGTFVWPDHPTGGRPAASRRYGRLAVGATRGSMCGTSGDFGVFNALWTRRRFFSAGRDAAALRRAGCTSPCDPSQEAPNAQDAVKQWVRMVFGSV